VKSPHQILSGVGVYPRLSPDRGVDHGHQGRGYLDDRNTPHESGGNEAGEVADDPSSESDDGGVAAEAFGEHLVGEPSPGLARLVVLSGRKKQDISPVFSQSADDALGVPGSDVRIGDDGVAVGWRDLLRDRSNLRQQAWSNPDRAAQLALPYQVTSPAPVRTFATRASMKRRSERRLR